MSSIAERLKILRGKSPQSDFSVKIGLSQSTYSRYERGDSPPDAKTLEVICNLFGVEPSWLLMGQGAMYKEGVAMTHDVITIAQPFTYVPAKAPEPPMPHVSKEGERLTPEQLQENVEAAYWAKERELVELEASIAQQELELAKRKEVVLKEKLLTKEEAIKALELQIGALKAIIGEAPASPHNRRKTDEEATRAARSESNDTLKS